MKYVLLIVGVLTLAACGGVVGTFNPNNDGCGNFQFPPDDPRSTNCEVLDYIN